MLEIEKLSHVIISRLIPLTSTEISSICCIRPMTPPAIALEKLRTLHMRAMCAPGGTLLRLRSDDETVPSVRVLAFLREGSSFDPVGMKRVTGRSVCHFSASEPAWASVLVAPTIKCAPPTFLLAGMRSGKCLR